ncbi:MAG: hypothetical protein QF662_04765, partial [Phycisphaerae bacterium]|nr:hypothetical protein [Phycisphaerae bacterium]
MKGFIQVADDNWNFVNSETGEIFIPHGAAYFNTLYRHWPPFILRDREGQEAVMPKRYKNLWEKIDTEMALMEDLGCNVSKTFIESGYLWPTLTAMDARAEDEMAQYLDIAAKHGIRLWLIVQYVTTQQSPSWSKARRERVMYFEEDFYHRFGNHPALFAEALIGESSIAFGDSHVNEGWASWVEAKYGTATVAEKAWNGEIKNVDFANLPAPTEKVGPDSMYLYDFKLYQEDFGTQIIRERANAVKRGARGHGRNMLVGTDINPWLFPNVPMHQMSAGQCPFFHNNFVDFQSIHLYPPPFCLPGGFGDPLDSEENMQYALDVFQTLSRMAYRGKPVIWGEWGWYGGCDSHWGKHQLAYRSEKEHADYCERMLRESSNWAVGWSNWSWCDFPGAGDITVGGGLYTIPDEDGNYHVKEWGKRYKKVIEEMEASKPLQRKVGEVTMDVPLRQLWTDPTAEEKFWTDVRALLREHKYVDFNFVIDNSTVVYNDWYLGGPRDEKIPGELGVQKDDE